MTQLYNSKGEPIVEATKEPIETAALFNFPPTTPKPEWFDNALNDKFGYFDGDKLFPKYRVVWGMEITHFAMGKVQLKYPTVVDTVKEIVGYNVINTQTNSKQFIKVNRAKKLYFDSDTGRMTKNVKPGELIWPVEKETEIVIGSPWWIVEQCVGPEAIGSKEEWNRERFLVNPADNTKYVDVLGEYPRNGILYLHWLDLLAYTKEGTEPMDLSDGVIDFIQSNLVFNIALRKKKQFETRETVEKERQDRWNEYWNKSKEEMAHSILDIKKNRVISLPS